MCRLIQRLGGRQHAARTGQNRKQMSERDGITSSEGGNEWTRAGGSDGGRQCFFRWPTRASLCQPLREAQISIRSASLCCLTAGLQRVPFFPNQASPTAGTAPDKKAHSEGDSSACRPPLGNGCDGRMSAFVDGRRAGHGGQGDGQREKEKERERELNKARWRKKRGRMH